MSGLEYWIDDVGRFNWETVPVQGKQISFVADDVRRERTGMHATIYIRLADIGILCSRRADIDRVQGTLRGAGIDTVVLQAGNADDRSIPGVRITTMHRAKGLEFFAVAIPFLSEATFPPAGALKAAVDAADREDIIAQNRSLLHVAATRAKGVLHVSFSGEPTRLMSV